CCSQYSCFGAIGNRQIFFRENIPISRSVLEVEYGHLSLKLMNGAIDKWFIDFNTSVVNDISYKNIIRSINDQIEIMKDYRSIFGSQILFENQDFYSRIFLDDRVGSFFCFIKTQLFLRVKNLPMKIRFFNLISVNNPDF